MFFAPPSQEGSESRAARMNRDPFGSSAASGGRRGF